MKLLILIAVLGLGGCGKSPESGFPANAAVVSKRASDLHGDSNNLAYFVLCKYKGPIGPSHFQEVEVPKRVFDKLKYGDEVEIVYNDGFSILEKD